MFGPELIRVDELMNELIKTARSVVLKNRAERRFFFLENMTLVARWRKQLGLFWRYFWLLDSL